MAEFKYKVGDKVWFEGRQHTVVDVSEQRGTPNQVFVTIRLAQKFWSLWPGGFPPIEYTLTAERAAISLALVVGKK